MGGVGRHAQANQVHGTAQGRSEIRSVCLLIILVKLFVWPLDDDPNHAPLATNNAEYYHFRTD